MKINNVVQVLICVVLLSCNSSSKIDDVKQYLDLRTSVKLSENQYYFLLNTNSCSSCNDVIMKFINQLDDSTPINLILKGNSKRDIKSILPFNKNSNFDINFDTSKRKTKLKMPILIISKNKSLEIYEINTKNYSSILSKIE